MPNKPKQRGGRETHIYLIMSDKPAILCPETGSTYAYVDLGRVPKSNIVFWGTALNDLLKQFSGGNKK